MSSLELLVSSRKYNRAAVTRIYNDRTNFANLSPLDRQNKIVKLQTLQNDLKESDKSILKLKFEASPNETEIEIEMSACESYQDGIRESLCALAMYDQLYANVSSANTNNNNNPHSQLKSPTAPLPQFTSGEGENLDLFLRNLEDTIFKFNYAEYDKFLLLKQQVTGRASYLLDSLEPDRRTFTCAKGLLQTAFATSSLQKFNVIKQMCEMKLDINDEPFKYIGEIKKNSAFFC